VRQAIIRRGSVQSELVPAPQVSVGGVLIKVVNSCISAGTESSAVAASTGKSIFKQAMEQPQKIKKAFDMVRDKGIAAVYSKVKEAPDEVQTTGYSVSGIVIGVGSGVTLIKKGDYVAAAGAGAAHHAEFVDVPENLVVQLPENVEFKTASTVALGAIALQGVRRADLRIGENCVVVGAGMIGLIAVQILRASGIRTVVVDLDNRRLEVARLLGAERIINPAENDAVGLVESWSGGFGVDAVLFCAATSSNEPLSQAFKMCRRKGRVILVGVSGMEIRREDIYKKELDFMVSTSYGPGRYDRNFEEKGVDYPYAYVRWTERRNMLEYLRLIGMGDIRLDSIIEKVFPIEQVGAAFESLIHAIPRPLGAVLDYGNGAETETLKPKMHRIDITTGTARKRLDVIRVALVGCGGFARGTHLPNLDKLKNKYQIHAICNRSGHIAKEMAARYGAVYATTDFEQVIQDEKVDLLLIATRHNNHASYSLKALNAGKNVFVEKPLATTTEQLQMIRDFYSENKSTVPPLLMVGYNRRFSVYTKKIKQAVAKRISPLMITYRMNAGYAPPESWIHEDGGRIVGEACHIIDLITYIVGTEVEEYAFVSLQPDKSKFSASDNKSIILKYKDGSVGTIQYLSVGSKLLSKEYMEVHFDEKSIVMDDYVTIKGYGVDIENVINKGKGHFEELECLHATLSGETSNWPISIDEMLRTTEITLDIATEMS